VKLFEVPKSASFFSPEEVGTNKVRYALKVGANDLSVRSISMTLETLVLEIEKSSISSSRRLLSHSPL